MMKELKLSAHTWDHETEFKIEGVRGNVSLHQDYNKVGDGIYWGMQHGGLIKGSYTEQDIAHRNRMKEMEPIKKGEIVLINGEQYKTRVLGDYSDCVIFDKI